MGDFSTWCLALELKSKTRNGQLVEASHLMNMADTLNRLGFFDNEFGYSDAILEGAISDGHVRIYFE